MLAYGPVQLAVTAAGWNSAMQGVTMLRAGIKPQCNTICRCLPSEQERAVTHDKTVMTVTGRDSTKLAMRVVFFYAHHDPFGGLQGCSMVRVFLLTVFWDRMSDIS